MSQNRRATLSSTPKDPTDLLVAILANFPETEFKAYDTAEIIKAIYKTSKKEEFKGYFRNVVFNEDGLDPECRALSIALDSLQCSSLLGRLNPYLVSYRIAPGINLYYRKHVKNKIGTQAFRRLSLDIFEQLKTLPATPIYA